MIEMDDKAFQKKLGQVIRSFREEKGVTQQELGYRCDFEKTAISRIEAGNVNITVKTLRKIARALDVPMGDLIAFDHDK